MLHVYGIRHHGPGSAKALLRALSDNPPDCLLVESPADAEKLVSAPFFLPGKQGDSPPAGVGEAKPPHLVPPVAMLVYDPKNIQQASYLPFALFSPEWQAIGFALRANIPVRFMDLPMEVNFMLDAAEKARRQVSLDFFDSPSPDDLQFQHDPLGYLAQLAGYTDYERWWEAMFENADNGAGVFSAILQMVATLREEVLSEKKETLLREAYMRQAIRQAVKAGFKNIAAVCGAWHAPALHGFEQIKASHDAALLKGLKKVKTTATWIPWSYDRLTFASGYGAGVLSPAWYEFLFDEKNSGSQSSAAVRWMVEVARLFRGQDLDVSAAHVVEGVRLAEALAAMRGLAVPGIEELKDAAVTAICDGSQEKLQIVENQLIVGNKVGSVPEGIPVVPLQKDIEEAVKSARLTKYWENTFEEWLGATAASPQGGIDLREETGRLKSHLLHRLHLLGIPWGRLVEINRHQSAGGFKEFWKMKWSPDFAIAIIEKGAWGNTVEAACVNFLRKKTADTTDLGTLSGLVKQALNAHLPAAFDLLVAKLENLAAVSTDVFHLMDTLPPLAQVVRYGNTRGTDVAAVRRVVQHLVPRICIGLPSASASLDEDASWAVFEKLAAVNRALHLLNEPALLEPWYAALLAIADSRAVNGLLCGACTRLLFDKKMLDAAETAIRTGYALSPSVAPLAAAQWLEGFLQGSGLLLLHNRALWDLLDAWVASLGEGFFADVLPLLRRTFSRFPQPERERMLDLAKQHGQPQPPAEVGPDYDAGRAAIVLPTLQLLLG